MSQKLNRIIEAIELSDSIFPQLDGYIEYISTDKYIANYSNDSHCMSNRVSSVRLSENNADDTIKELISIYKSKNCGFVWSVCPLSTPSNLADLLKQNGFEKITISDGLYLGNLNKTEINLTDIEIKEIPVVENSITIPTMAEGFEMPLASSESYHKLLYLAQSKINLRTYAAIADGVEQPVGCAYLTNYPNRSIALLGGAVTLPDYQKRGIYTAMLNQRINDAIDDGIKTVITIADSNTSAPICHKYGFKKACQSELFKYSFA